jgi:hypothetical protein
VFWGRYFTSTAGSNAEYHSLKENRHLRDAGIRVLPIARQTRHVNGTEAQGSADAKANANDVLVTFSAEYLASQGGQFFVFLDVEGAPSLSQAYYAGWAQTLSAHSSAATHGEVTLLPCVYATQADTQTWTAVAKAAKAGIPCNGAWVARWQVPGGCHPLSDWDDSVVNPAVRLPCRVLVWQYSDDCHGGGGFDCSQVNPSIDLEADLLAHLILPPS